MTDGYKCRIWETRTERHQPDTTRDTTIVTHSPRAGGAYEITLEAQSPVRRLDSPAKALLTTWLVDQRLFGVTAPLIASDVVDQIEHARPLSVADRADRLLRLLAAKSPRINQVVAMPNDSMRVSNLELMDSQTQDLEAYWEALAWSESTELGEIDFLVRYLEQQNWVTRVPLQNFDNLVVTVEGYAHIQEMQTAVDTRQAFVAMWFDEEMEDAFSHGIAPAIEDAGFSAMRIDRKEHANKIDDEIIAEIRRSGFLVADFSQGEAGARGGVYFEAGFALGLGIPVIYTCRKSDMRELHFDTRQYNHIDWESHQELRDRLKKRILAIIGEGPGVSAS